MVTRDGGEAGSGVGSGAVALLAAQHLQEGAKCLMDLTESEGGRIDIDLIEGVRVGVNDSWAWQAGWGQG